MSSQIFLDFLYTVFISLNLVILEQFRVLHVKLIYIVFHNGYPTHVQFFLDFYKKNLCTVFIFFCKFSLDHFYSISHVQIIYTVFFTTMFIRHTRNFLGFSP